MKILSAAFLSVLFLTIAPFAQTSAPGAPGNDARWEGAGKQGIGTANSLASKVWFTLQGGALTEVFYPTADMANVQNLQFVVFNPATKKVETERDDATHQIEALTPENNSQSKKYHSQSSYSLTFKQINTAKSGEWKITKTYIADPNSDVVLINVQFQTENRNTNLYVYYDPSLGNSGMHDTAWTENGAMLAKDANIFSAVVFSFGRNSPNQFQKIINGFSGISDGLTQLKQTGELKEYARAESGNVVQVAQIPADLEDWKPVERMAGGSNFDGNFTIALSFGDSANNAMNKARQSLFKGYERTRYEYEQGWQNYVKTLPKVEAKYQTQLNFAAMVLKAHEDKTYRGGQVASLSNPWIYGNAANEPNVGGYHLVWSRDLYQVATAYMALGDSDSAKRALNYLFTVQQREDGSFPQITWLDGRPLGDSIQMDEVSYPLILAHELGLFDGETYRKHIKRSADYIVKTGPKTQQERWEEKPGYSPATIAAEIAGLVCAAEIAKKNGDETSANLYLKTADDWAANVEKWTATTTGKYGDGNYYLRLTKNGKPDAGEKVELNNNGGIADEREIVDAGFLELVRLGIKSPDDKLIVKSLAVIDEKLKVKTPNGESFYRYVRDGYGEIADGRQWNFDGKYTGKGHLWALLAGERGQYEIASANSRFQIANSKKSKSNLKSEIWNLEFSKAKTQLDAMLGFANDGLMIPEQIWDVPEKTNFNFSFGEGAESATPLAWSMAQFIRLTLALQMKKNPDTPAVVFKRYAGASNK